MSNLKKLNKPVLAEGEVTGHAHVIDADVDVYLDESSGSREFHLDEPATIVHEEHNPITIEEMDDFEVGKVQEYDHFLEESRNVQD